MMILILVFVVTLLFFRWVTMKPQNYPPGPPCIPIFGSLPFIPVKNFHFYLEKAKKKYGPVMGFIIGSNHVVAIAGANEVREVLLRSEFQGRPNQVVNGGGIMFNEGQPWSVQRRFTIRHLRDFGFGKRSVEKVVIEEFEDFVHKVVKNDEIIEVSGLFNVSAINVLWAMMGGERYNHDNKDFKSLLDCIQRRFRSGDVSGGIGVAFPIIKKLFPNLKIFKEEGKADKLTRIFLQESIEQHRKSKADEPRDFIDVYLNELEKKDLHHSFSEETLRCICRDLFTAGSESIGNSIGFCLLYSVLYPEWQEKMYREIKDYDENYSGTYLEGRKRLAQTEAFINEVSRCNPVASIAVPHKTLENTTLSGHFIPKNTICFVSLWSVLQDKDYWKDPENFRPERFLDDDGNFRKHDGWMPIFGIGPRLCPGETLARNFIFIFLICLIRKYKFIVPEGHSRPKTLCLPGFTNAPQPFQVKFELRN